MDKIQNIIDAYYQDGKYKEAYTYMLETMKDAITSNQDDIVLGIVNELMGYYRVHGDFDMGEKMAIRAINILEKNNLQGSVTGATTYLNIATLFRAKSDFQKASEYFDKCHTIYKKNLSTNDQRYLSLLNNMSIFYHETNNIEKAISYAKEALDKISKIEDAKIETAISYTNIAQMYVSNNQIEKGEECLKKAIELFKKYDSSDPHYFAAIAAIGQIYFEKYMYKESLDAFKEALIKIEETFGKNQDYQVVYNNYQYVLEKQKEPLKGLTLSRLYYNQKAKELFYKKYPEAMKQATIGLVGPGSECFGYDDEISKDHDFGPGFCIWLPDDVYKQYGSSMQETYDNLDQTFLGYTRLVSHRSNKRVGIFSNTNFFNMYLPVLPTKNKHWFYSEESTLAMIVSGQLFENNNQQFTDIRTMLKYYPRDVQLKKMIKAIAIMSQAGQYNYPRCYKRKDNTAMYLALSKFIESAIHFVYLANKKYMPFYKWSNHGLKDMKKLTMIQSMIDKLVSSTDIEDNISIIENICIEVVKYLQSEKLSKCTDSFLDVHIEELYRHIEDVEIKELHIMEG